MARARRWGTAAAVLLGALCGPACRRAAGDAPRRRPPAPNAPSSVAASGAAPLAVEDADSATRTRRAPAARAPVIWLGLDGLDWELLDRLVAEGRMPNWKRLTAEGYSARLQSFMPAALARSSGRPSRRASGPDVHRVLDFQEVDPASGQKVPISGRSRAVPAIWNVASAAGEIGRRRGLVGDASGRGGLGLLRVGPREPDPLRGAAARRRRVSGGARGRRGADPGAGRRASPTRSSPASSTCRRRRSRRVRAGTAGLENPLVALVAHRRRHARSAADRARSLRPESARSADALLRGHRRDRARVRVLTSPPRMSCVSEADFARYRARRDEYYALVDRILGQWMRRAEEDGATLIVNSDHGFRWGADRPCETAGSGPAARPTGIASTASSRPGARACAAAAPRARLRLGLRPGPHGGGPGRDPRGPPDDRARPARGLPGRRRAGPQGPLRHRRRPAGGRRGRLRDRGGRIRGPASRPRLPQRRRVEPAGAARAATARARPRRAGIISACICATHERTSARRKPRFRRLWNCSRTPSRRRSSLAGALQGPGRRSQGRRRAVSLAGGRPRRPRGHDPALVRGLRRGRQAGPRPGGAGARRAARIRRARRSRARSGCGTIAPGTAAGPGTPCRASRAPAAIPTP